MVTHLQYAPPVGGMAYMAFRNVVGVSAGPANWRPAMNARANTDTWPTTARSVGLFGSDSGPYSQVYTWFGSCTAGPTCTGPNPKAWAHCCGSCTRPRMVVSFTSQPLTAHSGKYCWAVACFVNTA